MRTFLIAVLLAGVALPALAARPNDDDRTERHHERADRSETLESSPKQERSAERPQHSVEQRHESSGNSGRALQSSAGNVRSRENSPIQTVEQVHGREVSIPVRESHEHQQAGKAGGNSRPHNFEPKEVRAPRGQREALSVGQPSGDTVRNWRSHERNGDREGASIEERNLRRPPAGSSSGDLVQSRHPVPRVFEPAERRVSRKPVFGTEPPAPQTATSRQAHAARHWNADWRHDNRYDWKKWRHHHRSSFHFGSYYDPFGWDYMRYGIGWRLWPSYYRSNFWLNDPWQYRLPPAYGPYRWVRYYNDALLVNIYTGQVLDVEYNFFW